MRKARIFAAAACVLLLVAGCKKQEKGERGTYTTIDWKNAGTIEGTIHYAGTPPKPIRIDMAQDPACTQGPPPYTQQYVVNKDGGFANVFVYVKGGLGNRLYTAPSDPVKMDQKGCRYVPHVVGVMVGQPVRFTNSDPTMHNVHMMPTVAGNQTVDISQAPHQGGDERVFRAPELMMPVRCNNHPWMQAFINVVSNPFYAVSDASGRYVIRGLPPGTYTVLADQEQLGQRTAAVTVGAKQTAKLDFTYSGTAQQ